MQNQMNKYQEALDYVNKSVCTALSCLGVNDTKTKESLYTLQELVDKEKSPTLEEVKKAWEELGYEWCASNNNKHIVLIKEIKNDMYNGDYNKIISINSIIKNYACYIDESYSHDAITFEEYQLLTKTFKALGWL